MDCTHKMLQYLSLLTLVTGSITAQDVSEVPQHPVEPGEIYFVMKEYKTIGHRSLLFNWASFLSSAYIGRGHEFDLCRWHEFVVPSLDVQCQRHDATAICEFCRAILKSTFYRVSLQYAHRQIEASRDSLARCAYRSGQPDFQCQNHMRVVIRRPDGTLYTCGTNAMDPSVNILDVRYFTRTPSKDLFRVPLWTSSKVELTALLFVQLTQMIVLQLYGLVSVFPRFFDFLMNDLHRKRQSRQRAKHLLSHSHRLHTKQQDYLSSSTSHRRWYSVTSIHENITYRSQMAKW